MNIFKSILFKIAEREYWQTVKKKSFWLSTLAFPLAIIALGLVSGLASNYAEEQVNNNLESRKIAIFDETGLFKSNQTNALVIFLDEYQTQALEQQVAQGDLFAAVVIPKEVTNGQPINIVYNSSSLFESLGIDGAVESIIKASAANLIENPELKYLLTQNLNFNSRSIDEFGQIRPNPLANLVLPVAGMFLYITLVTFSTSYLLRSVSEEKENRMIEIMLTNATARQLVWGKVLGQLGIVFTQMLTLLLLSLAALFVLGVNLPAGFLDGISLSFGQVFSVFSFVILGFLSMAGIMVMAASAVGTFREAQSFSTVFILLGILPVYFVTVILADPNGSLAQITSLIPLTSPLIMVMRIGVTELSSLYVLGIALLNLVYVGISFVLAFKIFSMNAVEYSRNVNWLELIQFKRKAN